MEIHLYFVLIPILLLLAAFFAATEASLFSLTRTQLDTLKETKPGAYRVINSLIKKPDDLLSTMIIGNECLSVLLGTLVATLLQIYAFQTDPRLLVLSAVLITTLLSLIFSEILPKVLAFRLPLILASIFCYPALWLQALFTPLRKIFTGVSTGILRVFKVPLAPPETLTEKDLLTLIEVGAESGSLERSEKEMIENVFHLSDLPVSAVMTPWKNVFHLSEALPVSEVIAKVRAKPFSRVPVTSEKDRHLVGILYTKELLKLLLSPQKMMQEDALQRAIFPPYYVSTHKKVSKLFREFKTKKVHIALVVDEYGRQLGVVTLEDILNSLFKTKLKQGANP